MIRGEEYCQKCPQIRTPNFLKENSSVREGRLHLSQNKQGVKRDREVSETAGAVFAQVSEHARGRSESGEMGTQRKDSSSFESSKEESPGGGKKERACRRLQEEPLACDEFCYLQTGESLWPGRNQKLACRCCQRKSRPERTGSISSSRIGYLTGIKEPCMLPAKVLSRK